MRIPVLQLLISGASLAIAIPLKVVVDGPIRPPSAVRVGLAGAGRVHTAAPDVYAETIDFSKVVITSEPFSGASEVSKPHCGGAKAKLEAMKNKIHEITHEFTDHIKEFFGFDVLEASTPVAEHEDAIEEGEIHILPLMPGPVGPPKASSIPKPFPPHIDADTFVENQNRNRMWMHRERPTTLAGRIHKALHSLSPWEGRALSFVVGCGIGVLLRMLWVFTVLTFRFFFVKQRSVQLPATEIPGEANEDDADKEYLFNPPEYEYDEKADQ